MLDAACDVLEELKAVVLAAERSEGVENIYHKRHIAAGIPSMYGDYTEPKFDALGLSFRMEVLVSRLLEDVAETLAVHYLSRNSQRKLAAAMPRFERVLAIEGLPSRQLADHVALLNSALARTDFTFAQFRNIVQFLAQSVSDLTRLSILSHDQVLRTILEHDCRECERRDLGPDAIAEAVLREVLVSALGVQTVDRYVAGAVQVMGALADRLDGSELTRMMHYDPKRLISWIDRPQPDVDDQITLGAKARGLKHLAAYGFTVPDGFILTTELFAAMPAMRYRPLYDSTIDRIRAAVTELEERTGRRLGDTERPLTLSIRSGAPVSMPGLMVTFPNVGLNDRLVEAMASDPAMAWTAWDSYRRFVQSWAMSAGVDRDVFDEIMTESKERCDVTQKLDFTAAADARPRPALQGGVPSAGRGLHRRPVPPGHHLYPMGPRVVGLGPGPILPRVHRAWRPSGARP